ncbi:MAG: IgGFc-binding protein [Kofleriaceae bacterium]|nr:IgGFc-binding protein [Myxococcales bacterium]MCB9563763.1 IgGFc-binding protein [Kofleriaceae bacterium]
MTARRVIHQLSRAAALAALTFLVACGPASRGNGDGGGDDIDGGGTVDAYRWGDGRICENVCSADLHQVLDCDGNVVQTCPADMGCGAGGCVPACDAADDNKSTIGCDYYSVSPDVIAEGAGACFAAFIANTWGSPVTINVDRDGTSFPLDGFARIPSGSGQGLTYAPLTNGTLQPGEVAILFLARYGSVLTNCPAGITPAYTTTDAAVHGTGYGAAFHITTSAPVVAYDIFPYGGGPSAATSATLLVPTSAWDVNYVAVDAFRKSTVVTQAQPSVALVGAEDNTTVTIRPSAAIVGGAGVAAAPANTPTSYTLNRGQILQFTQDAELIGSPIQTDKPVGLWAGATCLSVDVADVACDSAHQQIPPVAALGHRYASVRYRNRFAGQEESVPWRLVGAVDGTTLSYSPTAPAGAPTTLAVGQVAEFWAPGPFVVESQDADHPFYLSAHMTGCLRVDTSGGFDCRGDPEFVNVIPTEQYLAKYTFFTDPTYPETNLVLVREKKNGAFADVNLDCLGTVGGWQPLDGTGDIEYTRVDLVTGNFAPVGGCDNGRHEASSDNPFGLVVWGWGSAASTGFLTQAVSYAYPAGASVKPINTVVVVVDHELGGGN